VERRKSAKTLRSDYLSGSLIKEKSPSGGLIIHDRTAIMPVTVDLTLACFARRMVCAKVERRNIGYQFRGGRRYSGSLGFCSNRRDAALRHSFRDSPGIKFVDRFHFLLLDFHLPISTIRQTPNGLKIVTS
jgi:hypothetical protein